MGKINLNQHVKKSVKLREYLTTYLKYKNLWDESDHIYILGFDIINKNKSIEVYVSSITLVLENIVIDLGEFKIWLTNNLNKLTI